MSTSICRIILGRLGADEVSFNDKKEVLRHRNFAAAAAAASFAALVPLEVASRSQVYALGATLLILAAFYYLRSASILDHIASITAEVSPISPSLYEDSFLCRFVLATLLALVAGALLYFNLWPIDFCSAGCLITHPFLALPTFPVGALLFIMLIVGDFVSMTRLKRRLRRAQAQRGCATPGLPSGYNSAA